MRHLFFAILLSVFGLLGWATPAAAQGLLPQTPYRLSLLDRTGQPVTSIVDGNALRIVVDATATSEQARVITVTREGNATTAGSCIIAAGQRQCTTGLLDTLGWYWDDAGEIQPRLTLQATLQRQPVAVAVLTVAPRPVVLVHGFGADFHTWDRYLGPSGFLARLGVPGYAVGDGQATGALNTGLPLRPGRTTNTIAQNAAVLAGYLADVKAETGAEMVDLVVHSMGGLISRYYIDRLMDERDVAQLIMLGTPNGGSDCALLTGGLRLFQPAALELRTDYVRNVFNAQIADQKGVPFINFAGTPIQRRILSPCTATPNDLVVSLESAGAFTNDLVEVPYLHIDLNPSEELFDQHVAPLLRRPLSASIISAAPLGDAGETTGVQFSMVFTGTVTGRAGEEQVIHIDRDVAVASFGIYDPSRSLTVTVRGASGNEIALDPDANGFTVLDDPDSLFYLGYGFDNPRPGPWRVTVQPTLRTPPLGTTYAIVVQYVGGATLDAAIEHHLVGIDDPFSLTATLRLGDEILPVEAASAVLTHPDGSTSSIPLGDFRNGVATQLQVAEEGIYGLDVSLRSTLADGIVVERATFLAFQAFERAPARSE